MDEQIYLVLKTKWFEMIRSGEKREEYRDLSPHWKRRLMPDGKTIRQFRTIRFRLGYRAGAPDMIVECKKVRIGPAKTKWSGGSTNDYFVFMLGDILKGHRQVR
jgi:hypothetical protein